MAGSSLLVLIDDIATLLDDVALMTKVAAKKTAGVLGDDLALNAEQVSGVKADRELPVVWAVAKGSLLNKVILVPGALAISYFLPWLIIPMLMLGGLFLCYEGFEKVAHKYLHSADEDKAHHAELEAAVNNANVDMLAFEEKKIKGAIRTDFILSAEIIVITLGTVAGAPLLTQLIVLIGIALVVTVGVYGIVAGIVRLDDLGLYLMRKKGGGSGVTFQRSVGRKILVAAPYLMKGLAVVGTVAMFLVGGGIISHGIPVLHHLIEGAESKVEMLPAVGSIMGALTPTLLNLGIGLLAGALVLAVVTLGQKIFSKTTTVS
jgi:predicted DNA repair protein MutK